MTDNQKPGQSEAVAGVAEMIAQLRRLATKQEGYGMSFSNALNRESINLYGDRAKAAIWLLLRANDIADALSRPTDWWNPEPGDPFWMLEAEDGEWLKNEHSMLGTRDATKAMRFPTEQDAYNHPARMTTGYKWWFAVPTEHAWIEGAAHPSPAPASDADKALNGYRAAVSYIGGDSWDGCSDCIEILKAARSADMTWDWAGDSNRIAAELKALRPFCNREVHQLPAASDEAIVEAVDTGKPEPIEAWEAYKVWSASGRNRHLTWPAFRAGYIIALAAAAPMIRAQRDAEIVDWLRAEAEQRRVSSTACRSGNAGRTLREMAQRIDHLAYMLDRGEVPATPIAGGAHG